ncbi:MAG: hypothetical protein AB7D57_03490 [Desulfovibrionaceae bacterium]
MDVSSLGGYESSSSGISGPQAFGAQSVAASVDIMTQDGHSAAKPDSSQALQTSVPDAADTGRGTILDQFA